METTIGERPRVNISRSRSLRLFFVARAISIFGSQVTLVALPWLVITTTGSATKMGVVSALEMAVVSVLSIPAGVVIDKVGARRYLIISDLILALLTVAICACFSGGKLDFTLLLFITALIGIPNAGYASAASVALRGLVGESSSALAKASADNALVYQFGSIGGKAVAGVIVGVLGVLHSMYVDAASFVISFLIFFLGLPRGIVGVEDGDDQERDSWLAGVSMLVRNRRLLRLVLGATLTAASFAGVGIALPAALARNGSAPFWLGVAMCGLPVGAIVGSAVCRKIASERSAGRILAIGVWFKMVSAVAIPLLIWLPEAGVVSLIFLGVAGAFEGASLFAILGGEVPEGYMGRVLSAAGAFATVLAPLSALAIGVLLDSAPMFVATSLLLIMGMTGALVQLNIRAAGEVRESD